MIDVTQLRMRLESIEVLDKVLPTRRNIAEFRSELTPIADLLSIGEFDRAESRADAFLERHLPSDRFERNAIDSFVRTRSEVEQLVGFLRAGLMFFRATDAFLADPPESRSGVNGNSVVTRVLRTGRSVLLETRRLVVRFAPDATATAREDVQARYGLLQARSLGFSDVHQFRTTRDGVLDACLQLLEEPAIVYAHPDFIEHIGIRQGPPAEEELGDQWHHKVIGTPAAWAIGQAAPVTVAIIENGFAPHPELEPNASSGWFKGTPEADDAGFVSGVADMPPSNHGTACAGMIAAVAKHKDGVGVAYAASLCEIACLEDQIGTQTTLAKAIHHAIDAGADVITCSLGPNDGDWKMMPVLSDAIDATASGRGGLGTPTFWACGNDPHDISLDEVCSHQSVIVVNQSDANDMRQGGGHGSALDFLAPGVAVYLPQQGGGYDVESGTSFACPCAGAVGALVLSHNGALSAMEVRDILRSTCVKIGIYPYPVGRNDYYGFGRIAAKEAVEAAKQQVEATKMTTYDVGFGFRPDVQGSTFRLVQANDRITITHASSYTHVSYSQGPNADPANGSATFGQLINGPGNSPGRWERETMNLNNSTIGPSFVIVYSALVNAVEDGKAPHGPSRIVMVVQGNKLTGYISSRLDAKKSSHSGQWR